MLGRLASYFLGGSTEAEIEGETVPAPLSPTLSEELTKDSEEAAVADTSDSSDDSLKLRQTEVEGEDWILIDHCAEAPAGGMDESWFVTPPACFTRSSPVHVETSPLENLLIEHPSMSVYEGFLCSLNNSSSTMANSSSDTKVSFSSYVFSEEANSESEMEVNEIVSGITEESSRKEEEQKEEEKSKEMPVKTNVQEPTLRPEVHSEEKTSAREPEVRPQEKSEEKTSLQEPRHRPEVDSDEEGDPKDYFELSKCFLDRLLAIQNAGVRPFPFWIYSPVMALNRPPFKTLMYDGLWNEGESSEGEKPQLVVKSKNIIFFHYIDGDRFKARFIDESKKTEEDEQDLRVILENYKDAYLDHMFKIGMHRIYKDGPIPTFIVASRQKYLLAKERERIENEIAKKRERIENEIAKERENIENENPRQRRKKSQTRTDSLKRPISYYVRDPSKAVDPAVAVAQTRSAQQVLQKRNAQQVKRNRLERANKVREVASGRSHPSRRQDRLRQNNSFANNNRKC